MPSMDKLTYKAEALRQEMDLVSQKINHFDDLRHRTKHMAMALWVATVGAGLATRTPALFWLAAVAPIPFWYSDATYHCYQEAFTARSRAIREFLRTERFTAPDGRQTTLQECLTGEGFDVLPVPDHYATHTLAAADHRLITALRRNAWTPKMVLFYAPLILGAVALIIAAAHGMEGWRAVGISTSVLPN
jgi:hypothetical protein